MKKLSIAIRHHITYEEIKDLLDSASRGSSYWCENTLAYESSTNAALTKEGITVKDTEADSSKPEQLNLEKIKKGLTAFANIYPEHFANFLKEDYDEITGDIFLQCCLLGEVKYN